MGRRILAGAVVALVGVSLAVPAGSTVRRAVLTGVRSDTGGVVSTPHTGPEVPKGLLLPASAARWN